MYTVGLIKEVKLLLKSLKGLTFIIRSGSLRKYASLMFKTELHHYHPFFAKFLPDLTKNYLQICPMISLKLFKKNTNKLVSLSILDWLAWDQCPQPGKNKGVSK